MLLKQFFMMFSRFAIMPILTHRGPCKVSRKIVIGEDLHHNISERLVLMSISGVFLFTRMRKNI